MCFLSLKAGNIYIVNDHLTLDQNYQVDTERNTPSEVQDLL